MTLREWYMRYHERKSQYVAMRFPVWMAAERAHWDVNEAMK